MLRLLANENIPKRLVRRLLEEGIDTIRLQDLGIRGINDEEVVNVTNRLGCTILTRDSDYTTPSLRAKAYYGIMYIGYQPLKTEIPELAKRIAQIARNLEPKPGLLIVVTRDLIEIYD